MFKGLVNTFRKDLISSMKRKQQAGSFVKLKLGGLGVAWGTSASNSHGLTHSLFRSYRCQCLPHSHASTPRECSKFESLLQAGPCELKIVPLVILVRKFPGIQQA